VFYENPDDEVLDPRAQFTEPVNLGDDDGPKG